jgi:hypothetical protein
LLRNDDRCSGITLQGIDGKGIHPRHFFLFDFFIGTTNNGNEKLIRRIPIGDTYQ